MATYSTYLAAPAKMKSRFPVTLLPQLETGKCSQCGCGVIYHGPTAKKFKARFSGTGITPKIACPTCCQKIFDDAEEGIAVLGDYDKSVAKHFNVG